MTFERSRYPENWEQMTIDLRIRADHKCEFCGKLCRKPGEKLSEFILRVYGGLKGASWEEACDAIDHPKKYTLTGAHLDQNPANNKAENLKALCMPCHIRYDHQYLAQNRMSKRERRGQLPINIKRLQGV